MSGKDCSKSPEVLVSNAVGYLMTLFNELSDTYKMEVRMFERSPKKEQEVKDDLPF